MINFEKLEEEKVDAYNLSLGAITYQQVSGSGVPVARECPMAQLPDKVTASLVFLSLYLH